MSMAHPQNWAAGSIQVRGKNVKWKGSYIYIAYDNILFISSPKGKNSVCVLWLLPPWTQNSVSNIITAVQLNYTFSGFQVERGYNLKYFLWEIMLKSKTIYRQILRAVCIYMESLFFFPLSQDLICYITVFLTLTT